MNEREQVAAFYKDLTALVQRYIDEFDLSSAAAIGALAMKQHEITATAFKNHEGEEE